MTPRSQTKRPSRLGNDSEVGGAARGRDEP